jgi:ABC-type Mn2+/Zn2+ transport system permease subunit
MNPFSLPFMRTALAASVFTGTALSLLGVFMTSRRVAFSGLAVSQLAALGTVVGVSLFSFHGGGEALALAFVGSGMFLLSRLSRRKTAPSEAWVACLYVLGAGAAVLILSKAPRGESDTLGVFFGNVLSLKTTEVWESLAMAAGVVVVLGVWLRRWVWVFADSVSAEVSGIAVERWNFLFYALFAVAMTLAIHIVGVLLAFAYLILPAAAGFTAARRMKSLFLVVPLLSAGVTVAGFYASFRLDFPTGPFVAVLLAAVALGAGGFRRMGRGISS